ncbi:MAG: HAMP domain-containing sensor histidine kinase [Cyclobacteriaceae bacterium]
MVRPLRKILFLLIGAVLLPFIIFMVLKANTLNEDEKLLDDIYERQLSAILFSINQYSDDHVSNIVRSIEENLHEFLTNDGLQNYQSIQTAYFIHLRNTEKPQEQYWHSFSEIHKTRWNPLLDSIFDKNPTLINRLISYKKNSFSKLEPLGNIVLDQREHSLLVFILEENGNYWQCIMAFQPVLLIESALAPKMQEVAREDFVVLVRKKSNQDIIFTTEDVTNDELNAKPLWLLPDYEIAISPIGNSIKDTIKRRENTNLISLLFVCVVMTLGFYFVYINVRKEMTLAQNKADFVSNVSHEIKTPLSLISMFAETLLLGRVTTEEKKRDYYSIIQQETARLSRIVGRILDFSQVDANKKAYNLVLTNLNNVIERVTETYSFHLQNKGFEYEVRTCKKLPQINGDEEALVEALINLLDNAIKYSTDTKKVVLFSGQDGDTVHIGVTDFGIGIDPKKKRQIFEKFYRISENDVHDTKGVGLGLSLVQNIVDAHKGEVSVESTPGEGSTFKLIFPVFKKMTDGQDTNS